MIDGNKQGDTLKELLANRQRYLQEAFGASPEEFTEKLVKEIDRILQIPPTASVYLWFEEDLFCQANLWFCAHLLNIYTSVSTIALVLPTSTLQYGFGGMDEAALKNAYQNKLLLSPAQIAGLNELWQAYQLNEGESMLRIADHLSATLPFLVPAVKAHLNRSPDASGLGYPERLILTIQQELQTTQFPSVFKEFSKRAPIYGFGDLQVQKIWERVNRVIGH